MTDIQKDWFFLNLNDCVQGCYIPYFRVLASIMTDFSSSLPEVGRKLVS